jgi:hypothetical protein
MPKRGTGEYTKVRDWIWANGPIGKKTVLAAFAGLSSKTLSQYLHRLQARGLVLKDAQNRFRKPPPGGPVSTGYTTAGLQEAWPAWGAVPLLVKARYIKLGIGSRSWDDEEPEAPPIRQRVTSMVGSSQ